MGGGNMTYPETERVYRIMVKMRKEVKARQERVQKSRGNGVGVSPEIECGWRSGNKERSGEMKSEQKVSTPLLKGFFI
jgi:hypothetical protein